MKRRRQAVQILLHLEDTPHRTAVAFGIGVFIAFFPLLGIHTVMALGIAFAFRLNRAAMLIGCYINNPWTLAPLYLGGTLVGCLLLGVPADGLAAIDWAPEGSGVYRRVYEQLKPYLWPYVVGNTVVGITGGLLGYFGLRWVLERRRRSPQATAEGTA